MPLRVTSLSDQRAFSLSYVGGYPLFKFVVLTTDMPVTIKWRWRGRGRLLVGRWPGILERYGLVPRMVGRFVELPFAVFLQCPDVARAAKVAQGAISARQ